MENHRICLLEPLEQDTNTVSAARKLRVPIVFSSCGSEYLEDSLYVTFFVIKEFDGPLFEKLTKSRAKVLGSTALIQLAASDGNLSQLEIRRPLYNLAMRGATVCFTGYRAERELMNYLPKLIFNMGGRVRREMHLETTHLIAHHPGGEKYDYAETFKIPILADSWIKAAWDRRDDPNFSAVDSEAVLQHKLKLGGTRICFLGFAPEWTETYKEYVLKNNGQVAEIGDPLCTHLVINADQSPSIPESLPAGCSVVRSEWFWKSMENEFCPNVKEYLLQDNGLSTPDGGKTATPGSAASRARKRKRMQHLARFSGSPAAAGKRRSSANTLDFSGNFLDWTLTPDKEGAERREPSPVSPRKNKFLELVNTESNYVEILKVIVTSFKAPLDETYENGNPILDGMELKMIFGNLPPILDAHSSMLEDLKAGVQAWTPSFSIGEIILKKAGDLQKAYPPFINYFEKSKEALEQCETNNPRFHAFLKIRQSQPECRRQTLKELMIRPVQRLPSISLLLSDLLKHTEESHPDHKPLREALAALKEVMIHMNEDKRRTEAQLAMFALCNDIENCPPELISSHRSFIAKCECLELTDGKKGEAVTLMVFTDTLEICRKRQAKGFSTLRGKQGLQKLSRAKQFKHLRLLPLSHVRRIIDVRDTEELQNVFALAACSRESPVEVVITFSLVDESVSKPNFLQTLCRQLACTYCTPDPEEFYDEMDQAELGLEQTTKDSSNFTKAFKFASNAKTKMGRALSLSRTPSRASRIMPRRNNVDNSAPSPAVNQLAQMRLQSRTNLNDSITSSDSALHVW